MIKTQNCQIWFDQKARPQHDNIRDTEELVIYLFIYMYFVEALYPSQQCFSTIRTEPHFHGI